MHASKKSISSSIYSTRSSTQLSPILQQHTAVSLTHTKQPWSILSPKLNWNFHISSLAKSASSRLGVLYRLQPFFSPHQLLTIYRGLFRSCIEYASHVWGGLTHTALLDSVESKAFRLIRSPPLTSCLLYLKSRRAVASLSIFYR